MSGFEEWRPVAMVSGYEVSCLGRIRNAAGLVMRQQVQGGYTTLMIGSRTDGSRERRSLHRMVCEAFHGKPPTPKHHAAHADGDPLHNVPGNLRWATATENAADSVSHGTRPKGVPNRLTAPQRAVALAALAVGVRQPDIAEALDISVTTVRTLKRQAAA